MVEAVIRPGNEPDPHKAQDVGMMLLTRGRERNAAEFRSLYEQSGLCLRRIIPTAEGSSLSVLEGVTDGRHRGGVRAWA